MRTKYFPVYCNIAARKRLFEDVKCLIASPKKIICLTLILHKMPASKYVERCQGIIRDRGWGGLLRFIYSRMIHLSSDIVFEKTLVAGASGIEKKLDAEYKI